MNLRKLKFDEVVLNDGLMLPTKTSGLLRNMRLFLMEEQHGVTDKLGLLKIVGPLVTSFHDQHVYVAPHTHTVLLQNGVKVTVPVSPRAE